MQIRLADHPGELIVFPGGFKTGFANQDVKHQLSLFNNTGLAILFLITYNLRLIT
jgi:hypothetical protein